MRINAEFDQSVFLNTGELEWQASPMEGVQRRMLDRIGGEVARATSIVRYAAGSQFAEHTHSGGEEFIVLDGVFQDEHGDYPAGTYVRNPIGTHHVPRSGPGCTIFVKLWQFAEDDSDQFAVNLDSLELKKSAGRPGVVSAVLTERPAERVSLEKWDAEVSEVLCDPGGLEILLLDGSLEGEQGRYGKHDWIRLPPGGRSAFKTSAEGVRLWIKRGHLTEIKVPGN